MRCRGGLENIKVLNSNQWRNKTVWWRPGQSYTEVQPTRGRNWASVAYLSLGCVRASEVSSGLLWDIHGCLLWRTTVEILCIDIYDLWKEPVEKNKRKLCMYAISNIQRQWCKNQKSYIHWAHPDIGNQRKAEKNRPTKTHKFIIIFPRAQLLVSCSWKENTGNSQLIQ